MHLDCVRDSQLPKLAWLAILEKDRSAIQLLHGEWVETSQHFAFEGAWASDFSAGDFDRCDTVVGSGIVLRDTRAIFCSPSHTLSRLHVIQQGPMMYVSNSFVFCMAGAGRRLQHDYALYFRDFQSIVRGLRKYRTRIPLDEGEMQLVYMDNLVVGSDLQTEQVAKPSSPIFSNYDEYVAYMTKTMQQISANAASSSRTIQYAPISTISSGYDSPACAVLARDIGSTTAITFPQAREEKDDSGSKIAKQLGYTIVEVDRLAYQHRTDFPEAEFVAVGTAGDGGDIIFASLEDLLPGKLVVTGFTGDGVWNRHGRSNRVLVRGDSSGSLMEEFRLRVGFVHLPVPTIGALRTPELRRISRSSAMKPWVVSPNYDRPIPRRIVEEAGVPREWFGQTKKAVGARFFDGPNRSPEDLRTHLSPSSFRDYQQYFTHRYQPNRQEILYSVINKIRKVLLENSLTFNKYIGERFNLAELKPKTLEHYDSWIGKNWLLFHWAVEKTAERYEKRVPEVGRVSSSRSS